MAFFFLLGMNLHYMGGKKFLNQQLSNEILNLSQINTQCWTGEHVILKKVLTACRIQVSKKYNRIIVKKPQAFIDRKTHEKIKSMDGI